MNKADIISRLRKEISPLEGMAPVSAENLDKALWFFKDAFPNGKFPLGCVHEFLAFNAEDMAASRGFISSVLSQLLSDKKLAVWISSKQNHFPSALRKFAVSPDHFLFVKHHNEKELLWVAEEFLKYNQLSALVAELRSLDFTASRRFQLAVEKSKVTAFVLRTDASKVMANSSVSRWHVSSIPSANYNDLPGITFPAWHVELQKIRNGKPASFDIEYRNGELALVTPPLSIVIHSPQKATG